MHHQFTMSRISDDKLRFSCAKISKAKKYKKWVCEIRYPLEFAEILDHTLEDKKNSKPTLIALTGKDLGSQPKTQMKEKADGQDSGLD